MIRGRKGDRRVNHLREALRDALRAPLPGRAAQRVAWPDDLPSRLDEAGAGAEAFEPAAVLLALLERADGSVYFPLIRRPPGTRPHDGQISLPGGRCAPDEAAPDCALREAQEEIGLSAGAVEVLGPLTPVPVPVSRYHVRPFVGWVSDPALARRHENDWAIERAEVVHVLHADPDLLAAVPPARVPLKLRDGRVAGVPAYLVRGPAEAETVWGATAIVLAEFLAIWREIRGRHPGP
jgi:8-oxo-dGTP pyrophosphatase MutT (NUDIX family)